MNASPHIRAVALISAQLLTACGDDRLPEQEFAGTTMGTTYSVKVVAPPGDVDLTGLADAIALRLDQVNAVTSTYVVDSDISLFNASQSTEWFETSQDLCNVVEGALALASLTDGAFDVTVGPLVNLWGFGPDGSVSAPPDEKTITEARQRVGYQHLSVDCTIPALRKAIPRLYVDLSAYAKGYVVDEVAALLDDRGLTNYLVEVGGELFARGHNSRQEAWGIAIERPLSHGRAVQSVVKLTDVGLATSGDYRNYFEYDDQRFSHAIDPDSGHPVTHSAASVTVIAASSAHADAIATALLVMGPTIGSRFAESEDIAALFLVRNGDAIEERMTDRFAAEILQ